MRTNLFLLAVLFIFFSCKQEIPEQKPTEVIKTKPSVEDENIALAQRSFDAFNAHDWEKHASYFSDSCLNLDPSYGTDYVIVNRKEKAAKYKEMEGWSPDIKDSITNMFASGNKVTIQFTSFGTSQGKNGPEKWSLPICCVFTIKNGLIVCDETYYNNGK